MSQAVSLVSPPHSHSRFETLLSRALPYLLLAPALIAIGVVILYPMVYTLGLSFFEFHLLRPDNAKFIGLTNYSNVLNSPEFWRSLGATVSYTLGTVIFSFLLGLVTALMLNVDFRFRGLARALIVVPWATPWLVTTLIWYIMFNPQIGPVNEILKRAGVIQTGVSWLYQYGTAMIAIVIATSWRFFPTATLLILAGLQSISPELYEQAQVDGAGWWARFRHITFPSLQPVNFVVLVLLTIQAFKVFTFAWVLTQGGPGDATRVLSVFIYEEAFKFYRLGTASTLATLLFILSIGLVVVYFRLIGKEQGVVE
jgi:multiple sugar transport system permease protein